MIPVATAIRAWVEVEQSQKRRRSKRRFPWRSAPFGKRVLVFDTETTTDHTQRLLFGYFRLYEDDLLTEEGLIISDTLAGEAFTPVQNYAARTSLRVFTCQSFIENIFYPEVYGLGTLCVGYNLAFDLTRIAIHAGPGRGQNRRKFRMRLSALVDVPDLHIEAASGRAAFITFVPRKRLKRGDSPFFKGRFLDLSTLANAFTGDRHTLRSVGKAFNASALKSKTPELGTVTREAISYCRQDVRATWALYLRLRDEYARHPFASFANERDQPKNALAITRIYSSASVAKQYLRLMGFGG